MESPFFPLFAISTQHGLCQFVCLLCLSCCFFPCHSLFMLSHTSPSVCHSSYLKVNAADWLDLSSVSQLEKRQSCVFTIRDAVSLTVCLIVVPHLTGMQKFTKTDLVITWEWRFSEWEWMDKLHGKSLLCSSLCLEERKRLLCQLWIWFILTKSSSNKPQSFRYRSNRLCCQKSICDGKHRRKMSL